MEQETREALACPEGGCSMLVTMVVCLALLVLAGSLSEEILFRHVIVDGVKIGLA
jgi:hypothetical protein